MCSDANHELLPEVQTIKKIFFSETRKKDEHRRFSQLLFSAVIDVKLDKIEKKNGKRGFAFGSRP